MFLSGVLLTLSPAGRARSWNVDYRWEHWPGLLVWGVAFYVAKRLSDRYLPEHDPYLLPAAAALSGWGQLAIYRLTPAFGLRQSLWLAISTIVFLVGLRLPSDLGFLRRYKYLWLSGGLLLTALTLFLGTNPLGQGPRLWLGCCGVYLQPSEPLKLLLLVYLAAYFAPMVGHSPGKPAALLPILAPTLVMAGLAAGLLLAQRDLGTGSILFFIYAVMLYLATGRQRVVLALILSLAAVSAASYALFEVVRLRVDTWWNPWIDPSGSSFQVVQSLMAVANGGLLGRGLGMGSPGLVPVAHSDFIFSAIAEESGLLGSLALLLLFSLLVGRGMRIAVRSTSPFLRLLAAGISAYLAAQCILITGGNLRLLPLTGVTLPFVSYGGSSLLATFIALLLLAHISNADRGELLLVTETKRYQHLSIFLLSGLGAIALVSGWWAVYRAPILVQRTDNARRIIAERYVARGSLLDRSGKALVYTAGSPGSYTRQLSDPALSVILGYNNPTYGQSGLEASLDPYLRGLQGYPAGSVDWNDLLYGQPPPGLNVRLTLDFELQQAAEQALDGHKGGLVLLNAHNGEVLTMASYPGFDANQLDADWEGLVASPDAPFVNRAVQSSYPAETLIRDLFPRLEDSDRILKQPEIGLAAPEENLEAGQLTWSPLQAALAVASLSAGGQQPSAVLASAIQLPGEHAAGWELLPVPGQPVELISAVQASQAAAALAVEGMPYWELVKCEAADDTNPVCWYAGGTLPGWQGTPLSLAVLIESNDPLLVKQIGQQVLKKALLP